MIWIPVYDLELFQLKILTLYLWNILFTVLWFPKIIITSLSYKIQKIMIKSINSILVTIVYYKGMLV